VSRVLTPTALRMLDMQPPVLRGQPVFQASAAAQAEQLDLLNAAIDQLAALVIPKSAGDYVYLWEAMTGVTVDPVAPQSERLNVVLAFLAQMLSEGGGRDWVAVASKLIGTGWTYYTHQPGAVTTTNPAVHHVTILFNTVPPGLSLNLAQKLFNAITPANTVVDITNPSGMLLDVGLLDVNELG
jgi:hypothetical protein